MKRPLAFRVVTALWGIWFAAALVGPATLHACPEHAALTHSSHADASGGASHSGVAEKDSESPKRTADADCNCLDECSTVSAIAIQRVEIDRAESIIAESGAPAIHDLESPAAARYYVQPFANGPPSSIATA